MLKIDIPGDKKLVLEHLVADYNGTLAEDGKLVPGTAALLNDLADSVRIHVITADTFGSVEKALEHINCEVIVIGSNRQDEAKLDYVKSLGPERTVCIGNGRNDILMIRESALSIAVMSCEGVAGGLFQSADVVCRCIADALELLRHPLRLQATLRC